MFSWVCPRCGHDVPPSKTECPFCAPPPPPPAPEQAVAAPPQQQPPQYAPPPPAQPAPPQYAPPQPPQQYWQQPAPPQYQQGPPAGYPPQYQPQYQQAPPQYWQPQYPPPPPQEPPPPPQYQYQPPPPPVQTYHAPPPPEPAAYHPPPPPPPVERRPVEAAPAPWAAAEEQKAGKPMWLIAVLAFAGVLVIFGAAYFLMGSHGSSAAKDAAKQATTNPLQKYVDVVGIRLVSEKGGQAVKFLVVSHSGVEMADLAANVTLWASTARSEEDSIGSFTFHVDTIGPNESKELTAPLKTDRKPSEMPEDWRNMNADVQITSPQQ